MINAVSGLYFGLDLIIFFIACLQEDLDADGMGKVLFHDIDLLPFVEILQEFLDNYWAQLCVCGKLGCNIF